MTQLGYPDRIYQRDTTTGGAASKGTGVVPVALSAVTTAGTLYARLSSGGGTRGDVQASYALTPISATGAQTVNVPVAARLGWFQLDLSGDGTTWQNGTVNIGMGDLTFFMGQSLMQGFMANAFDHSTTLVSMGLTPTNYARTYCSSEMGAGYLPTAWEAIQDTPTSNSTSTSAGAAEFSNRMVALTGVNIGLCGVIAGGTSISAWLDGQELATNAKAVMDQTGGKFAITWWFQGHNDASTATQTYQTGLTNIHTWMAAHNSYPNPTGFVTSIPNSNGGYGTFPVNVDGIRQGDTAWCAANGKISLNFNDIQLVSDGTHPTQVGARRMGVHLYRALRPTFGAANNDTGHVLGQPVISGSNITIPFTGAGNLLKVGNPETRWRVAAYGTDGTDSSFDYVINSMAVDNTAKTITLAMATSLTGKNINIRTNPTNKDTQDGSTNVLLNDVLDSDGITYGRQLFFNGYPKRVLSNRTITMTGTSTTAGKFGNTMDVATYALTNQNIMPSRENGRTIEFWVKPAATNPNIILSLGGSWFASTNGFLNFGGFDTASNIATTPVGVWSHIAVVWPANSDNNTRVYVNGVLAYTFDALRVDNQQIGLRTLGGGNVPDALMDEFAIFDSEKYVSNFTPPTAAYTGNEANLVALYHLDTAANSAA
jgi:hypothetical protein